MRGNKRHLNAKEAENDGRKMNDYSKKGPSKRMINELNPSPILVLLPVDDCKNVLVGGATELWVPTTIYDTLVDLFISNRRPWR